VLKAGWNTSKIIFLLFVVVGACVSLGEVLDFSDRLILVLSAPNRFGLYILSEEVRKDLKSYWERLKDGTLQAPAKEEKDS